MYMNSRMELSKTSNAPDTVFSHCVLAVSSFTSLTLRNKSKVSVLKTKVFVSGSILLLYLKRSWVCDKPYLHFVNLEGAYEERLKAAWDSSTPYEKKTKGWQQGTHAAMFSWAKDSSRQIQNKDFREACCSVSFTLRRHSLHFLLCGSKMKRAQRKKQHLASFCMKSCLWCNSTCLTFQTCLKPTYVELN